MAAITDLTWQQLQDKLPAGSITVVSGKVTIDVGILCGITADAMTDTGVVKFAASFLNAAQQAQSTVNEGQTTGERLSAFNPVTNGNVANGYINLTRTFNYRSELASATNVVGINS